MLCGHGRPHIIPVVGRWRQGVPRASLLVKVDKSVMSVFKLLTLTHYVKWLTIKVDATHQSLTSTQRRTHVDAIHIHMCTHRHANMHTYMHTCLYHTHKHAKKMCT